MFMSGSGVIMDSGVSSGFPEVTPFNMNIPFVGLKVTCAAGHDTLDNLAQCVFSLDSRDV